MNKKKPIKVLEGFAGIRATSEALSRLGIEHTTTTVEFDKKVQEVANQLWKTNEPTRDVTKILDPSYEHNLIGREFDMFVGGFPCQPFSMAGKGQGFHDEKGRGTLYIDTLNVIDHFRPDYVILENVKAITFKNHKWIITEIEETLKGWGYFVHTQIINAKDYLPQNRERVFVMASKIKQPREIIPTGHNLTLKDILEDNVPENYFINPNKADKDGSKKWLNTKNYIGPESINFPGSTDGTNRFYKDTATHKGALLASNPGKVVIGFSEEMENKIKKNEHSFKELLTTLRLRTVTPREAWRLQGWRDDQIDKVIDLPKNKLYHTVGNSMAIPVMQAIVEELIQPKENYCVVCGNNVSEDETFTDLGSFNSVICNKCEDTDEAKEELGLI